MRAASWLCVTLLLAGLCACSNKENRAQKRIEPDADAFERAQDPPISADTHYAAGVLQEEQNAPTRAIEQYRAALRVDPKHLPSMYNLAIIYTRQRMYELAIGIWQQYVKATDQSADAYSNLGYCYEVQGKLPEAESAYKKGIARNPNEQACRFNYGRMLARQGRAAEAAEQLSVVMRPAEVHYDLGSIYEEQGKVEQAKAEYQKALLLDASLHDAKRRLAGLK